MVNTLASNEFTARKRKFHITIGASPTLETNLRQELELIKVALLYGEETTLYSVGTAGALHTVLEMPRYSEVEKVDQLINMVEDRRWTPEGEVMSSDN
ncbi:MAG: hypothetical protein M3R24_11565 [Chloroflexota bacterium]|nr:hypothetical protein [Chloroflexota bacterium]